MSQLSPDLMSNREQFSKKKPQSQAVQHRVNLLPKRDRQILVQKMMPDGLSEEIISIMDDSKLQSSIREMNYTQCIAETSRIFARNSKFETPRAASQAVTHRRNLPFRSQMTAELSNITDKTLEAHNTPFRTFFNFKEANPSLRPRQNSIMGTSGLAKEVKPILLQKEELGLAICENLIGTRPHTRASILESNQSQRNQNQAKTYSSGFFQERNSILFSQQQQRSATTKPPMTASALSECLPPPSRESNHRVRHQPFLQKDIQMLRDRISETASQQYSMQESRITDKKWKAKPALHQCAIQFTEDQPAIKRKEVIKAIINQQHQAFREQRDAEELKAERKLTFMSPAEQKKATREQLRKNRMRQNYLDSYRHILEHAQLIVDHSKYENEEDLYNYIKSNFTRPLYKGEKDTPAILEYKSSALVKLEQARLLKEQQAAQRNQQEDDRDSLKEYFDRKEKLEREKREAQGQQCFDSMVNQAHGTRLVKADDVAREMTATKEEGALHLLARDKPQWYNSEKELQEDFNQSVGKYCDKLNLLEQPQLNSLSMSDEQSAVSRPFSGNTEKSKQKAVQNFIGFQGNLKQQINALQQLKKQTQAKKKVQSFSNYQEDDPEKQDIELDDRFINTLARKMENLDLFSSFANRQNELFSLDLVKNSVVKDQEFQQLCKKQCLSPTSIRKDYRASFFSATQQGQDLAIDIFHQIVGDSLLLKDYRINEAQAEGLYQACCAEEYLFSNVIIDNCGLTDKGLARVLESLLKQRKIKMIVLRHCNIGVLASEALEKNVRRCLPLHVERLIIQSCQITGSNLTKILESVQDSSLEELSLVDVPALSNATCIKLFTSFVAEKAKYLTQVDCSYNKLTYPQAVAVLTAISCNKKLQFVNLSYNYLTESGNFGNCGSAQLEENENIDLRGSFKKRELPVQSNKRSKSKEEQKINKFNKNEKFVLEIFEEFMSENFHLRHFDLTECGLSGDMILHICKLFKLVPSLCAIHFSGNPGVSDFELLEKIQNRIGATFEKKFSLPSFASALSHKKQNQQEEVKRGKQLGEAIQIKKINKLKQIYVHSKIEELNNAQKRHLILTRKQGHEYDIPGSKEWHMYTDAHQDCYICDRRIYTIFLWSPTQNLPITVKNLNLTQEDYQFIADFIMEERETNNKRSLYRVIHDELKKGMYLIQPSKRPSVENEEDQSELSEQLSSYEGTPKKKAEEEENPKTLYMRLKKKLQNQKQDRQEEGICYQKVAVSDLHIQKGEKVPMLYGQFNNWQPQPMVKLSYLVDALSREEQSEVIKQMKDQNKCRDHIEDCSQMNYQEKRFFDEFTKLRMNKISSYKVWEEELNKMILYDEPHFNCNADFKDKNIQDLYITAEFIQDCRQDYAIQYGKNLYLCETIAPFRSEPFKIPPVPPEITPLIPRNPNVFKYWQMDTQDIVDDCIRYDTEAWKVPNFVKDPQENLKIQNTLKLNFLFLKRIFQTYTCRFSYPFMSAIEFTSLLNDANLFNEKRFHVGIADTNYVSTYTNISKKGGKIEGQPLKMINRFEFFELLIRCAKSKYVDGQQVKSVAEAFDKIVNDIQLNVQPNPIQMFREYILWTRDVNLVLDANAKPLYKLWLKYAQRNKLQKMSIDDAIILMTKEDTKVRLSYKDAHTCFCFSLQTCTNIVKQAVSCCQHMTFLEFNEMIGRVADLWLNESEKELHEKIIILLDQWLPLVEETRKEAQYFERPALDQSDDEGDKQKAQRILKLKNKRQKRSIK